MKIRFLTFFIFLLFVINFLLAQENISKPLIKCTLENKREYLIYSGELVYLLLKSDSTQISDKIKPSKILSLLKVENSKFYFQNSDNKSIEYSHAEIHSIQRIEKLEKSKGKSESRRLILMGIVGSLIAFLIGLSGFYTDPNDDQGKGCINLLVASGIGIISLIILIIGIASSSSKGKNYKLIDKEILFENPSCDCEFTQVP